MNMNQKTQANSSAPIGCSAAEGPQLPVNPARSADDTLYFVVLPYDFESHAREHAFDLEQDGWEAYVIKASKTEIEKLKLTVVPDDH